MAALCFAATAYALPAFNTGPINMQAGPDNAYPLVSVVPSGATLELAGCLAHQTWCDVGYQGKRGWVYGERLLVDLQGRRVLVPEATKAAVIPTISFNFDAYWKRHYAKSPWWPQYARWQFYVPAPRLGWGAPPPGTGPQSPSSASSRPAPPPEPAAPTLFSDVPPSAQPPKAGEPGYMPSLFRKPVDDGQPWRPPGDSWVPPR